MEYPARLSRWTKLLVWTAAGLGLVLALALAGVRAANSSEPLDAEGTLGDFAFGVVYVMPFALSLWALSWKNAAQQAAVWLAAGVLAFLASFSAFSGVSLVFLPTGPLLILGGLWRSASVVGLGGLRHALPILPIAAVLAAVGVGAFFVLLTLTSDSRCWVLNRYPDGRTVWEPDPNAYIAVENLPGGGQRSFGGGIGGPAVNGVQRLQSSCTSDVISPLESAASLGMWALAVAGLEWMRRYGQISVPVRIGG
jgi:hypothetical protein